MTNMEPNKGEIVMYQPDETIRLEVRMDGETVWLSQAQMAELFKSSRTNVVEHIQHIYEDEELVENLTCRKFRQVRQEGKRMVEREIPMYNLDMIISVGYRNACLLYDSYDLSAMRTLIKFHFHNYPPGKSYL